MPGALAGAAQLGATASANSCCRYISFVSKEPLSLKSKSMAVAFKMKKNQF
jgi:hypothetical protein